MLYQEKKPSAFRVNKVEKRLRFFNRSYVNFMQFEKGLLDFILNRIPFHHLYLLSYLIQIAKIWTIDAQDGPGEGIVPILTMAPT